MCTRSKTDKPYMPEALRALSRRFRSYPRQVKVCLEITPGDRSVRPYGIARPLKPSVVKGYAIDLSAQLDSLGLIYAWFDHAMREGRDLRC